MSHAATAPFTGLSRPQSAPVFEVPAAVAETEEKRWMRMLLPPFLVSSVFFGAAIGTGALWLIGPAMALGPGLIIFGLVYLALTSDSNAE